MVMTILSDPDGAGHEMAVACETILVFMLLIRRQPPELFGVWIILGPCLEQTSDRGRNDNLPLRRLLDAF